MNIKYLCRGILGYLLAFGNTRAAEDKPAAELEAKLRTRITAAIPKQPYAPPNSPRRLLIINRHVRDGVVLRGHASIPMGNFAIQTMGEITGAYAAEITREVTVFQPDRLNRFDAVCFLNTAGVLFDDPELRRSLLDFVASGHGFVGIHAAAATFVQWPRYDQWPEFGRMLGGYEDGGHPWGPDESVAIKIDAPDHPLTQMFPKSGFQIADEIFQFRDPYSRSRQTVLLSIDTQKTDMDPDRHFLPARLTDRDFPVSWIRSHGRGRVFYCSLGHSPHIYWNQTLLRHYLAGIQYALGDLPIPQ